MDFTVREYMEKKSRQVLRREKRDSLKNPETQSTHEVYWIPLKRKSRAGVEYTIYKKVIDIKGLKK